MARGTVGEIIKSESKVADKKSLSFMSTNMGAGRGRLGRCRF